MTEAPEGATLPQPPADAECEECGEAASTLKPIWNKAYKRSGWLCEDCREQKDDAETDARYWARYE